MFERNVRKMIFNGVADDYEAIRPGYPDTAIERIISESGIPDKGSVLEVGCGSGQATQSFAGAGYNLTCLDISPALLAIAQAKFANNPDVTFHQSAFEEFDGGGKKFDLILAASSWHWVDPRQGYHKAASLLTENGSLAVIASIMPKPFRGFFERVQVVYNDVVPEWGDLTTVRTTASVIRSVGDQMEDSTLFNDLISFEYEWEVEYSRDQYLRLLSTYSDHRLLGPERLERLLDGIGKIMDEEYGGSVIRPYVTVGYIGKRKDR